MSRGQTANQSRKRKRSGSPQRLSNKQRKSTGQENHETPSAFWDNLSRQWLTPRALQEFDRRTIRTTAPIPPDQPTLQKSHIAQLKRFARRGGPDLSNLRAYPERGTTPQPNRAMSSSRSRLTTEAGSSDTPNTRKTSAYDAVFEQHLNNNGIYLRNQGLKPSNWQEINTRLRQPRPSLSPSQFSEEEFEKFQRKNDEALSEAKVMSSVLPVIAGNTNIPSQENILYNNLAPLTDGTITALKPDFYDGVRPEQVDQKVREELAPFIVPSKGLAPILPNLFAEAKGPGGRADVAKRQACYDGAVGARAMQHMRSYGGEMQYDGNAYTVTSTYNSGTGTLIMYITHPTRPAEPSENPNYQMTLLKGWVLTSDLDSFRQGATAFRNARDWAKEQRDAAITLANENARANYEDTHAEQPALNPNVSLAADLSSDSDTSEDEGPAPAEPYTAKRQPSMSPQHAQNKRQQLSPPTSSHSSLQSGATISLAAEGEERWEWSNGSFRCRIGQTFVKQQSNAPMDVWVYYDAGWPEQLDKKWRRCESVTGVTYYS